MLKRKYNYNNDLILQFVLRNFMKICFDFYEKLLCSETIDDEEELLYGESSVLNIKKESDPLPAPISGYSRKPQW